MAIPGPSCPDIAEAKKDNMNRVKTWKLLTLLTGIPLFLKITGFPSI
jgi:hypothetical protein